MRRWGDRVGIAGALAATQALGACAGGPEDPGLGLTGERLNGSGWHLSDVGDFNEDHVVDVLWDDTGKSTMAVWLMSGTDVLLRGAPIPGPPGAAWSAAWASDFDADGASDVRWYNQANEGSAIWLMNGTELFLAGSTLAGPLGDGWTRVTSTDFNADGMADLLWRNTVTGAVEVWLMNATELLLPGPPIPAPIGDGWGAATAGDFNADGMADVLWYNATSHSISVALMSATALLLQGSVIAAPPGDGWGPIGASDFNGDGVADVIWFNAATQRMAVWLMAGTEVLLPGPEIPAPPGGGWRAVTTRDFTPDGIADVFWENTITHRFAVWLMTGTEVLLAGPEIPEPDGP